MNKGDKLFWFEFPDQCLGHLNEVSIKCGIYEFSDDKYLHLKPITSLSIKDVDVFLSKDEAINAMIEHLNKLRSDNNER